MLLINIASHVATPLLELVVISYNITCNIVHRHQHQYITSTEIKSQPCSGIMSGKLLTLSQFFMVADRKYF